MVFRRRFTVPVFKQFLRRLIRHAHRRVFLIVDQHPVHCATTLKPWLKAQREQIRLFFLPGYSPELNPDKFLNQDVKTNTLGRQRPETVYEMIGHVRRDLWSTQRQPHIVKSYFRAPTVCYAAT